MSDYKKMCSCMFLPSSPVQSPRRGAHVTAPVHPISRAASFAAGALRAKGLRTLLAASGK